MRPRPALFIFIVLSAMFFIWPKPARLLTVAERMTGIILIQTEKNGEAWYVYPKTLTRFYLGRPADAFDIMRRLGLGITNTNLAKIPVAGSGDIGDVALRNKLAGYILIQVEKNGEAWYVYPKDTHRYYLGRPDDAFTLMRSLGQGISNADLAQIPADSGLTYNTQSVVTSRGTFTVKSLAFDRKNPAIKFMTDTGNDGDCNNNCTALPLLTYVARRNGVAGMHGTYFCPTDYASCAGQTNFYFFPVYNSFSKKFINGGRIKFTTEPIVIIDTANRPFMYLHTNAFTSEQDLINEFAAAAANNGSTGVMQSAISNGPPLVYQKQNIIGQYNLDTKQATVKSYRGALAWKGDTIYLAIVSGATVTDSAAVMEALGMDNALNLDGGGSATLYNAGRYLVGPGRNLPNAIIITPTT